MAYGGSDVRSGINIRDIPQRSSTSRRESAPGKRTGNIKQEIKEREASRKKILGQKKSRGDAQPAPGNVPARRRTAAVKTVPTAVPSGDARKQPYDYRKDRMVIDVEAAPVEKPKVRFIEFVGRQKFDFSFFLIVLILLAFGLVMLLSATYATANIKYGDSYYFIKRQLIFSGIGLTAMFFMSVVDYHFILHKVILRIAVVVSVGLMVMVTLVGTTVFGAERWIKIGEITIQPSEILKLVTIMVIAEYMERKYDKLKLFWTGFFPVAFRVAAACGLVAIQPHLSATVIILVVATFMLITGGARPFHMFVYVAAVIVGGYFAFLYFQAKGFGYIETRLLSFTDPEADIKEKTYQTYQSLVTVGSGGWLGQGLGNSRQKYSFLPVTENDFIFSVIVEELGFVGAMLVIVLFLILVIRGFYIASNAPDKSGMLLCTGIVCQIGLQAFMNIAVAINAMPNTGVSLPFLSYGGTALIMQLAEIGIVLNISRKAALS